MKLAATKIRRTVVVLLCTVLLSAMAAPPAHAGRIHRVRTGFYSGYIPPEHAVYFRASRSNITGLVLAMPVSCMNSDTGESYVRVFDVGGASSQDLSVRRGIAHGEFDIDDGDSVRWVKYHIVFNGGAGRARFEVWREGGYERCDGSVTFRLRHSNVPAE